MTTFLLIIIYVAFIGLGLPDSIFGTAWPAINQEFQLPLNSASIVTLITSLGTVVSSLYSTKLIKRLGTGKLTFICTLLTAFALLGNVLVTNLLWLSVLALPLGLGAGAIDSALNNYVALHYKASHMNFLHCFYGIGVTFSPYLMALAIGEANDWRKGYQLIFYIQLAIAFGLFITLPVWKKVRKAQKSRTIVGIVELSLKEMLFIPGVKQIWLMFICSCGIEFTTGIWGSTFLVAAREMSIEKSALAVMYYYLGMTLGRFISGVVAQRLSSWHITKSGQVIILLALVLLLVSQSSQLTMFGLFAIGLGNGPIFPNLVHLTPENFGEKYSQAIMGSQMAAAYLGTLVLPPVFGMLAETTTPDVFPYFNLILLGMMFFLVFSFKTNKKTVS